MISIYKVFFIVVIFGGIIFSRTGEAKSRSVEKKINTEKFWVERDSFNNEDRQLDRKRSHKRRRKMRKPMKGLR